MAANNKLVRFQELSRLCYKDQAIWFLNGFWGDPIDPTIAEKVWNFVDKFVQLDSKTPEGKGAAGNELDQFWSAKFLEENNQTMSALARKEAFRQIDVDSNGKMSCLEYCAWLYKKNMDQIVDAPQGTCPELEDARRALAKVQQALTETKKLADELTTAVAELKKQEDDYNLRVKTLEDKVNSPTATTVQKSKAAAELAALKGEDPLPLRKAKITQEAALRKCQKQEDKLAQEMTAAQASVEAAKGRGGGAAPGLLWWMQRELFASDRYLPKAKQKFDHTRPFIYDPTSRT
ncbi:TolA protein [Pelomyxa schiedti]|nr:TolA protein [Pelomyxa schiedti]